ncbi:DUF6968 family protein [Nocardia pseudobrasiliensis]|uniref:DUF6968 domain-containing protein n=1 Tax=Nocardia pseudobrasiliensis TaxID=45979 RepID=A0A370I1N5_9NOCA|nr:hypothetical protein [Nocardia pseudobrasiliensis]RDI64643.1 hypothetical protein DFR76_10718 [Nocardia pseudobrasiliensis]
MSGVIMSRLVSDDGRSVTIRVDKPSLVPGGGAVCAFGIDGGAASSAYGSDELAALYRALIQIGTLLAQANQDFERVRFVGAAELGFPNRAADRTLCAPDMNDVVAARMVSHKGRHHMIIIGTPYRPSGQELALCPFRVDDRPLTMAGGWDGVHALLTAVRMIGAWLQLPQNWPLSTAP